jgi:two-component system chemotaxis response regulator CheB
MAPTTVLICDDSRSYAAALRTLIERDHTLQVVGISPSGEHALEAIKRVRPQLVTMDLELPGMDGLQAIRQIMRTSPVPVVVLSDHAPRGSQKAAAALAAGALEALSKAAVKFADIDRPAGADLRQRLKLLAAARVSAAPAPVTEAPRPATRLVARDAAAIAIGASTGGPRALRTVLRALPADFRVPLLVVQHIGAESLDALVNWIDGEVPLPVKIAAECEVVGPGVWISPDGAHLTIDRRLRVTLDHRTHPGAHCPSVDVLFESMANALGAQATGVVLTGMGSDGARGVAALTTAGGLVVAQDERSSVVFGMPRAAVANGAQLVLGLDQIPAMLLKLRPQSPAR